MTQTEHVDRSRALAQDWFKDHQATLILRRPEVVILEWKKTGTYDYAVRYLIYRNYVVVVGDLGEAIYGFGSDLTVEKLQSYDWHYFWEKTCASETGRQYTQKVPGIKAPVIHLRAIAHHLGLQLALKQLTLTLAVT